MDVGGEGWLTHVRHAILHNPPIALPPVSDRLMDAYCSFLELRLGSSHIDNTVR